VAIATLVCSMLVAAGCGGSNNSSSSPAGTSSAASSSPASSSSSSAGGAYGSAPSTSTGASSTAAALQTVTTANDPKLGTFLVDNQDKAIYMFEKDKRGDGKSTCYGSCAAAWPPVTTSASPKTLGSVDPKLLTTIKRTDGTTQLVYNGWPLYYFAPDSPGTTRGQAVDGFGAEWYVLAPSGARIEHDGS
jgi:predicted lipoprotein with Yx(FWY)xxD motif